MWYVPSHWTRMIIVSAPQPIQTPLTLLRCTPIDPNADVADDLLRSPTLRASRVNNVNAGRTNIKLDWTVEKLIDTNDH